MEDKRTGTPEQAILAAISELEKWRSRRDELRGDLAKVNRQVAYYESLTREMKREVRPPRVVDLLKALFQF